MAIPLRGEESPLASQPPLEEQLRARPYRFGFFQAVRILNRLHGRRQPVGHDAPPKHEVVRFHAHLSMEFPPSEIVALTIPDDDSRPADMTVAFMGLTGPSGALPRFYTEVLLERARNKDRTLRAFLDLFNHRLISLFFRAWERNRFWVAFEKAELDEREARASDPRRYRSFVLEQRPRKDLFSQCLLDFAGLGEPALRYRMRAQDELEGRGEIEDETIRYYCGLLAQQHRSAISLEGLLSDYFMLSVTILQFSGQWLYLEPENQTCLTEGGNVQLGTSVVVGERFWDMQGKFRIRLGPLTYRQFLDFLPMGSGFRPLAQLARLYAGQQFDMDLQVVLLAAEVPWCRLDDSAEAGARLGWNTWIRNHDYAEDASEAVFAIRN